MAISSLPAQPRAGRGANADHRELRDEQGLKKTFFTTETQRTRRRAKTGLNTKDTKETKEAKNRCHGKERSSTLGGTLPQLHFFLTFVPFVSFVFNPRLPFSGCSVSPWRNRPSCYTAAMISGHATAAGTIRFRSRFPALANA